MEILTYISISIFIGCLIAVMIALVKLNMPNKRPVQPNANLSRTTEARYAFEKAEYDLARATYALQFLRRSQVASHVIRSAEKDLQNASSTWATTLKSVFHVKRRARSASPESLDLYERFQPTIQ